MSSSYQFLGSSLKLLMSQKHYSLDLHLDQKMKDLLNPSQKNSLRITLLGFEGTLRHAQEWLDGYEENGILYRRKLTLQEEKRKQVRQEIEAALDLIDKLSHAFNLETESHNAAAMMRGELTVNWADLLDTRAGKLARFGNVHPKLAGKLDTDIQSLAKIAMNLSLIFGESQQEKP